MRFSGWKRVLLFIICYFFIVGSFQYVGLIVADVDLDASQKLLTSKQHLISSFFDLLGTFLVLWIFTRYIYREKFIDLGLQIENRFTDFAVGTVIGLITMTFGYFLLIGMDEIDYFRFIFNPSEFLISILLFLIVAVVEETLFRGYILKNMMESCNKYLALVLSSILFSLMHGFNPNISLFSLFGLFFAGMILGITYIYTKNLWYPIGLHFGWNFFQTHLGFNVSGMDFYSLIEFKYGTGNLFNGGEFGFEGSIFSIFVQLLILIGAVYYYRGANKRQHFRKLILKFRK